ncbi:methyl-accepting chemotaxis protein [Gloeocapsopsis dulcis]|nr:methyl-accepting chemotaxis protein [Gloeocapsopsis dulcis]WNN87703.1 methyl-accepting chemotaxis protein [Gloeocapsopsis dulcis]
MLDYRFNESPPEQQTELASVQPQQKNSPARSQARKSFALQWFYDLPISRKQLIIAATSLTSIVSIVGVGAWLNIKGLRTQLVHQAKSEVAVTEISYNIKVNQMSFGFRGQADNAAIVAAAKTPTLTPDLQNQVKQILRNEIKARNIEYATLVGQDLRIIVNANADRTGEVFNPNNLVKEVFSDPRQIKASAVVNWTELAKESPPLPAGFKNEDALIRYTVTPVRDPATKSVIGALVSGDIVNHKLPIVQGTLKALQDGYSAVYFRKPTGEFVLATSLNQGSEKSENLDNAQSNVDLSNLSLLKAAVDTQGEPVAERTKVAGVTYTLAAKTLPNIFKEEASGSVPVSTTEPVAILVRGTPNTEADRVIAGSLSAQLLLGLLALLANLGLVVIISRALSKPVQELRRTAQQFTTGNSYARAEVFAADEVGQLALSFNQMADSIEVNLANRRQEAERARFLKDITLRLGQYTQVQDIFNTAVSEIRQVLQSDRVVVYTFNEQWQGTVIAESVAEGFPVAFGANINDPCFADKYVERYRQGRVQATEDIYAVGLTECHIKQLEQFAVKANLVAPILQYGQLLGLLIAHQCSAPRAWQQGEIDMFAQLTTQVGFALDRANLLAQQTQAKEKLQRRALELLIEVDPLNKGDLTIRANVTEDEIGTIADSYNATISSLRQIVNKVKTAATQVAATTNDSEVSVQALSQEALRQAEEISAALNQLQAMDNSIRAVAQSAKQAEVAVQKANDTVAAGDAAMNRTVNGIEAIRDTVSATAQKVRQLGESSQKISKVVNLIGRFAAQTNLLALKASIEAARAGEEGRGFAVLADEVRVLASQSAQATVEIEKLVLDIQAETNAVVAAMEAGTEQVVAGTVLVDDTRQRLNQITAISEELSNLVQAIGEASVVQSQASEAVTQRMNDVATIASQTSDEATQVSTAFKQLMTVADELQTSVGQFKVN